MPLSRPVGGRYRLYLSLREGSEKTPRSGADQAENEPMELRKNWRKLTTAWTTTVTAVLKRSREQVIVTDSGRPATP